MVQAWKLTALAEVAVSPHLLQTVPVQEAVCREAMAMAVGAATVAAVGIQGKALADRRMVISQVRRWGAEGLMAPAAAVPAVVCLFFQ